jgi:tripartite-type tricarboxylate transporter receptor subunit TctC
MRLARRQFLSLAGAVAATPTVLRIATAQTYPTRPITLIVPGAVGGPTDATARIYAEAMKGALGQPLIVENVAGADGSIGTGRVARARPDGYTIDIGFMSTHALNGAFYSLNYDVLNDFTPIVPTGQTSLILVGRKDLPASDLHELIGWLKSHPGAASLAVATVGIRLLALYFQRETGTKFTLVPYRGTAPALQDLIAGQVDLLIDTPRGSVPQVRARNIRAYGVTSAQRLAIASDIPTLAEQGLPALSYSEWGGLFAPKNTPDEIVHKLNSALVEGMADPMVRARLTEFGTELFSRAQQSPEKLGELVRLSVEKWWPIIKEFGIKAG